MKHIFALLVVAVSFCDVRPYAAPAGYAFHKFSLWGLSSLDSKLDLYWGFTNGLVTGAMAAGVSKQSVRTPGRKLLWCLAEGDGIEPSQAVAMIDTYYKNNPENGRFRSASPS